MGYGKIIGWVLSKVGFAFAIKDAHNKTFYLNRKSSIHWFNRHERPENALPENAKISLIVGGIMHVSRNPEEALHACLKRVLEKMELAWDPEQRSPISPEDKKLKAYEKELEHLRDKAEDWSLTLGEMIRLNKLPRMIKKLHSIVQKQKDMLFESFNNFVQGLLQNNQFQDYLRSISREEKWSIWQSIHGLRTQVWYGRDSNILREASHLLAADFLNPSGFLWVEGRSVKGEFFNKVNMLYSDYFLGNWRLNLDPVKAFKNLRQDFHISINPWCHGTYPLFFAFDLADCEQTIDLDKHLLADYHRFHNPFHRDTFEERKALIGELLAILLPREKQELFLQFSIKDGDNLEMREKDVQDVKAAFMAKIGKPTT